MTTEIKNVVEALKKMQGGYEAAPKGLPSPGANEDRSDAAYESEGLTDPGIQNPVTGSGAGPTIGRRGRAGKG